MPRSSATSPTSTVILVVLLVVLVAALAVHLMGANPMSWMGGMRLHGHG